MRVLRCASWVLAFLLVACAEDPARLSVALRTDYVPGVEFRTVEVDLATPSGRVVRSARSVAILGEDYGTPRTVAHLPPVPRGDYTVVVRLLGDDERGNLATRQLALTLRESTELVASLERSCAGVTCAAGEACLGGRCVRDDCVAEPASCGTPQCTTESACPRPSACARATCADGVCYSVPNPRSCPAGTYCHPERGCLALSDDLCGQPCLQGECAVGHWDCSGAAMRCLGFLVRPAGSECTGGFCDGRGGCSECGVGCDAGSVDASSSDAGADAPGEVGPGCTPAGCDDGDPCTVDGCDGADRCTHTPSTDGTSCADDGLFCNGREVCIAGLCAHRDPPCEICSEVDDSCGACGPTRPCPGTETSPWSTCAYTGPCATEGAQSRTVTSYTCTSGSCRASTRTESQACGARTTEGTMCGAGSTGAWSSCSYGGTCSTSGSRTRSVMTQLCRSGACTPQTTSETDTAGCSRTTDGTMCTDDGLYCNGREVCAGGSCSGRVSVPCPGLCQEASDSCGECSGTGTCRPTETGAWSACSFGSPCATTGIQTRSVTTYNCSSGMCQSSTSTESQSCSRVTTGMSCGSVTYGPWGACSFGDTCTTTGTQSRTVNTPTCGGGTCNTVTSTQSQSCSRGSTDGTMCGTSSYSGWGACGGFADACDESGTQSRTRTDRVCSAGSCGTSTASESQGCSRSTSGTSCGTPSYGGWGACGGFSDTCDESGSQSRSVTSYTCGGGSCNPSTGSESQGCSRSTGGTTCGTPSYGGWGACGGFADACDESGSQSRSVTSYTCGGGSCNPSTGSESQGCSRSTGGTTCGTPSYGGWGACGGFADTCDEIGTRSRSVTNYVCGGGSCGSSSGSESEGCFRSTTGVSCGTTGYGSWGPCEGFSDVCDESGTQSRSVTSYTCGGGSCNRDSTTESQGCGRSTTGTSCRPDDVGAWGPCRLNPHPSGIGSTCSGERSRTITSYTCSSGGCNGSSRVETGSCAAEDGATCLTDETWCFGTCSRGSCVGREPPICP